jgi:hypothetical protein
MGIYTLHGQVFGFQPATKPSQEGYQTDLDRKFLTAQSINTPINPYQYLQHNTITRKFNSILMKNEK